MHEDDVRELVDRYESIVPDALRLAVLYDGDECEAVYVREDIGEMYAPEEFDEHVKQLAADGLGHSPEQNRFRLFGPMDVAVRRFERAIMLHFPIDEFAGVAVALDREAAPSIDTLANVGVEQFEGEPAGQ
ncbi:MAG: hypothetical protein ABEI11_03210 [Haloarculaceae archaeon]